MSAGAGLMGNDLFPRFSDDEYTRRYRAVRDAMVKACKETKWSPAVRDCLVAAADERGLQACQEQLTPEQRAQLDHASSDALQTP